MKKPTVTTEQQQQLMATMLQDGTTAYDYVMSWPEADQPWAMAGVTRPMMIRGMKNWSNWSKRPVNVLVARTAQSGIKCPSPTPKAMAIRTISNTV